MANDEQQEPVPDGALYASSAATTPLRRNQRRKQAIVGVSGAAVVLAGVAFVGTQLNDGDQPSLPEPAALAPRTPPMPSETTSVVSAPASAGPPVSRTSKVPKPAAAVERSPSPTPTPSRSPRATPSPAAASPAAATAAAEDPRGQLSGEMEDVISERTEALRNGTIRIVTAKRDLTGQRELLLAGDEGKPVGGGVRCTSTVTIDTAVPEVQKPTMLLCWRTSKSRSVVTMAVIPTGEPPTETSVDIIGEEWAKLG